MNQKIKISQLPAKGSNLAAADLLEIAEFTGTGYISKSITGAEIAAGATAGFVPETRTLTINGVTQDLSADRTFTISTGITIGTTAITSGTVGRVLFEGAGNVVQESANLFWDNTNGRLGIGTSSPSVKAHVVYNDNTFLNGLYVQNTSVLSSSYTGIGLQDAGGSVRAGFQFIPSTFSAAQLQNTVIFASTTQSKLGFIANSGAIGGTAQDIYFSTLGSNTTYQMQIKANGNVQIGTNTDAGFKLDVNGTARVQSGLANNSSATAFQVTGASGSLFRIRGIGDVYLEGSTPTIFYGSSGTFVGGGNANFYSGQGAGNSFFSVVHNNSNVAIRALSNSNVLLNPTAGNVLIGTTTDVASSLLTLQSTTKGFLPPRMTTTQRNAIASPAAGLMVYDTTLNVISYYNGTMWI